jgi:hypothetical protein
VVGAIGAAADRTSPRRAALRDAFLLIVAVCLALVLVIYLAGTARAEVYTCGASGDPQSNYFDGYYDATGGHAHEGAYATIVTRYGAVCDTRTGQGNFTSAWAMLAGPSASDYIQSGFDRWYGSCTYYFAEASAPSQSYFDQKYGSSCLSYGATTGYAEQYGSGNHVEYAKIGGTVWITTPFNPYSVWSSFYPEFFGETVWKESDMPGNSASPTSFNSVQYQSSSTHNFVGFGCSLTKSNDLTGVTRSDGESWYDRTTSCPSFNIYTDTAGH